MQIAFNGSAILVTGAGRGIGRAIVHGFAQAGAQVYASDVEEGLLHDAATGLAPDIAARIHTRRCDVTDPHSVAALVAEIAAAAPGGAVDVAVHAAGGIRARARVPIEEVSDEDWRIIQAVNVDGLFNLARAVAPGMKRARAGRIIAISSRAGLGVSRTGIQSYGAAKAAQIGLVRQLAAEFGPFGVTVNSVAPGFMPTSPDYAAGWDREGPAAQAAWIEGIAMRRLGDPRDIANAVLFFASEHAGWVTGQTLAVTGGP
jgi:3-oxoacyl-[acyl-carrier protein] reductase